MKNGEARTRLRALALEVIPSQAPSRLVAASACLAGRPDRFARPHIDMRDTYFSSGLDDQCRCAILGSPASDTMT